MTERPAAPAARRRRLGAPLVLFLVLVGAYLANGRLLPSGDSVPARYLPWSILQHGTLDLDPFPELYDEEARATALLVDGLPFYLRRHDGQWRMLLNGAIEGLARQLTMVAGAS